MKHPVDLILLSCGERSSGSSLWGNLSDIADELGERFLKIHRSYVVAIDKIENINLKAGTVTVGGHECAVSRKVKSELLRRLEQ